MARMVYCFVYRFFRTTGQRCWYWCATDRGSGNFYCYYFFLLASIRIQEYPKNRYSVSHNRAPWTYPLASHQKSDDLSRDRCWYRFGGFRPVYQKDLVSSRNGDTRTLWHECFAPYFDAFLAPSLQCGDNASFNSDDCIEYVYDWNYFVQER